MDTTAFAARLGIALRSERPDQLDADLLLDPRRVTHADLERVFGLANVNNELGAVPPAPLFVEWQREHLRRAWAEQDAARDARDGLPLVEPDLLTAEDFASPVSGTRAYDLWCQRREWVEQQLATMQATEHGAADSERLARLLTDNVASPAILDALEERQAAGAPIQAQLSELHLTVPALTALARMRRLSYAGGLLENEWADVFDLLIQVRKRRQFPIWRAEEHGLTLGPEHFRVQVSAPSTSGVPSPWRYSPKARREWTRTLQARIDTERGVSAALQATVTAVEQTALSGWRDAIMRAIPVAAHSNEDVADRLTQRLLMDMKDRADAITTRVHQATETLQTALWQVRTGVGGAEDQVFGAATSTWLLADTDGPHFDEEWRWLGSYANWRAAMLVFLHPENLLRPALRKNSTLAFRALVEHVRNQQVTPRQAAAAYGSYMSALAQEPEALSLRSALESTGWWERMQQPDQLNSPAELLQYASSMKELFSAGWKEVSAAPFMEELFFAVPVQLALLLQQSMQFGAALDWYRRVYVAELPDGQRKIYPGLVEEELHKAEYRRSPEWLRGDLNPHALAASRRHAYTRFTVLSIVRCQVDYADAEFARETSESIARARSTYLAARDLLWIPELEPYVSGVGTAAPLNPVVIALRQHVEASLFKIRDGRSIAGMYRGITRGPMDDESGSGAQLRRALTAPSALLPTPYRFGALIERAKQLVGLAQQIEASYLSALEKTDAENYTALRASQDLDVAQASVQLLDLRLREAEEGIGLAHLQRARSAVQEETYAQWSTEGLNEWEQTTLRSYAEAAEARNLVAVLDGAMTVTQALASAASSGWFGTGFGPHWVPTFATIALSGARTGAVLAAQHAEAVGQVGTTMGHFERRQQEWALQRQIASADVAIGDRQIMAAEDHVRVVAQERSVQALQATHSDAVVRFLSNKFTNAVLYEWMSGVLAQVYSYFLQQATAVAKLAQAQLAFERQDTLPSFIESDYGRTTPGVGAGEDTTDRRGLTGSARLLQDVYRLDQHAFATSRRRLELTKTISLVSLAPFEFQRFRETGTLRFGTLTGLFERDFPSHYLRLIRRVRLSLVALTVPSQGICATLSTNGISRVVVGPPLFHQVTIRREPESIALSSPVNASGLFDLDTEPGLLLPFEGMGVDTSWEFSMPKASNAFDYRTIADALLTLEYTALSSEVYGEQVMRRLDRTWLADRAFSLRRNFPDQWYAVHNSGAGVEALSVSFTVTPRDFPINVEDVRVQNVMFGIIFREEMDVPSQEVDLGFLVGEGPEITCVATSIGGLVSTRRGAAAGWAIRGKAPFGQWRMTLRLSPGLRQWLETGRLQDIFLDLSYSGVTPPWPTA